MNSINAAPTTRSNLSQLLERLNRVIRTPDRWRQRHIERMQVARIDSRILRDAGISDAQRFIAINKPYWEA